MADAARAFASSSTAQHQAPNRRRRNASGIWLRLTRMPSFGANAMMRVPKLVYGVQAGSTRTRQPSASAALHRWPGSSAMPRPASAASATVSGLFAW